LATSAANTRLGQAQLHHRDQAVPTGDDADIVTMAREDGDGRLSVPIIYAPY
jgi:hypothetical protein